MHHFSLSKSEIQTPAAICRWMRWYIRWSNCFWRTKTDKPLTRPNKSRRPSKVQNRFSSTHSTRSQLKRGLKDVFSIFPYFVTGIRFKNGRDCTFSFHFAPKKKLQGKKKIRVYFTFCKFFCLMFCTPPTPFDLLPHKPEGPFGLSQSLKKTKTEMLSSALVITKKFHFKA